MLLLLLLFFLLTLASPVSPQLPPSRHMHTASPVSPIRAISHLRMRASIPASIEPFGSPRDQGMCWGDTHGGGIPSSLASAARPPRRGRGERYARWPPGAAAGSATASAKKPNCRIKESMIVPEPGALGRGAPEAKVARQGPRSDAWKSAAARPGRAARRRGSGLTFAACSRAPVSTTSFS